jgi:hypothetical protein
MELKTLEQYTDRELLELIISNQVRTEQRIYKMYTFVNKKYNKEFNENSKHKIEILEEFLDSYDGLGQQINETISQQKD